VEIASPAHFIPELPGWHERSLVQPERLRELFEAMEPRLHRYPAVDPRSFRKRLDDALRPRS
jgi:hypothetical protein